MLANVLDGLCRLLHPIVPFVTEQVWQALGTVAPRRGIPNLEAEESVCIAAWPSYPESWEDAEAERVVGQWKEKVAAIRNLRAERNVPSAAKVAPILVASGEVGEILEAGSAFIASMTNASSLTIVAHSDRPAECAVFVFPDAEVILPMDGLIDREAELARHKKALVDIDRQLAAIRGKLGNEGFVARAPAEVVAQQRAKEAELLARRESVAQLVGPSA